MQRVRWKCSPLLQHQFDYRLRTCSGSDSIMPSAAEFDRALDRALAVYSPGDLFTDPMLARRRVLPVSRPGDHDSAGGFGIRSRVDLMPRAFLSLGCARAHARAHAHRTRAHAHTHAHACSHVCSLFASMSRFFALLVPLDSCCAKCPVLVNTP